MMHSVSKNRFGYLAKCMTVGAMALTVSLAACSKKAPDTTTADTTTTTTTTTADPNATVAAASPAAPATPAPAADNTDTISGVKYASYTGDAVAGKADFTTCMTCHSIDPGVNKIGPSLHGVVGRKAGSIDGFSYSAANKSSGITWTEAKLFQYLENPQRVVPGTKMTFPGWSDPQKRADVIAYLKSNS